MMFSSDMKCARGDLSMGSKVYMKKHAIFKVSGQETLKRHPGSMY
jgi:hypothetical protein